MSQEFYSNGKLLITGEYAVLDGALSLALPTNHGQHLRVSPNNSGNLHWQSLDEHHHIWFSASYKLNGFQEMATTDKATSNTLVQLLLEARKLNPSFLLNSNGCNIETKLTFPKNWGLGSSSTLINNIAQWAKVNAYELLWNAFSGSGYDIACAQNNTPITYQLTQTVPYTKKVYFNPPFKSMLYFVHLNKKQNSRDGIAQYRNQVFNKAELILKISEITKEIISCTVLSRFESLLGEHEKILSEILKISPVKKSLFPNYNGAIKSLGAWGGDFILATGGNNTPAYFKEMGFETVIPYSKMILPL